MVTLAKEKHNKSTAKQVFTTQQKDFIGLICSSYCQAMLKDLFDTLITKDEVVLEKREMQNAINLSLLTMNGRVVEFMNNLDKNKIDENDYLEVLPS